MCLYVFTSSAQLHRHGTGEKAGRKEVMQCSNLCMMNYTDQVQTNLCSTCVHCNHTRSGTEANAARGTADLLGSERCCTIPSAGCNNALQTLTYHGPCLIYEMHGGFNRKQQSFLTWKLNVARRDMQPFFH